MKNNFFRMTALAAALLVTSVSLAGENDVLYWMVDSGATVTPASGGDAQGIQAFFDGYGASADSWFAARVCVSGGEADGTILDLYDPSSGTAFSGVDGVEFMLNEGAWGAGTPTGNLSPIFAYSAGTPEYRFIVEIGNVTEASGWTTVATSAAATYSELQQYIQSFNLGPSQPAVWTPTQFQSVPEPSGGLLTLMGVALLALRRRRMGEVA